MKQCKLFAVIATAMLTYLSKDLKQRRKTKGLAANVAFSDPRRREGVVNKLR